MECPKCDRELKILIQEDDELYSGYYYGRIYCSDCRMYVESTGKSSEDVYTRLDHQIAINNWKQPQKITVPSRNGPKEVYINP